MFLVGLTGGIATGKTTVSKVLLRRGVQVIDADEIARQVVEPGTKAFKKIVSTFGPTVLNSSGELNRTALSEIIFQDSSARKKLNSITHPEILKAIIWRCCYLLFSGHHYVVLDIPLLFETGKMIPYLRNIIVVICSKEQQRCRLMSRNNLSQEEAESRITAQWPLPKKCALADTIIDNSSTQEETERQVHHLVDQLNKSKAYWKLRLVLLVPLLVILGLGGKLLAVSLS